MPEFVCNICGATNHADVSAVDRESPSCSSCGSNIRVRGLMRVLSLEMFGSVLTLPEFPRVKSLRGVGMTDFGPYAERLVEKFDYQNTFYDRAPKLDICNPPAGERGFYDFIISSEVFEHVSAPEAAFGNACQLLKPNGVLVLSVPYSLLRSAKEHFPDLHEFGLARVGEKMVLVNRTRSGELQTFENLTFHGPGAGRALEMREFNEAALREMLSGAGFKHLRMYSENDPEHGIFYTQAWSLPIGARKSEYSLGMEPVREIVEELAALRGTIQEETRQRETFLRSKWVRIGKKLGLL